MNRRGFFRALAGAAVLAAADPDELLFVPGRRLFTFGPLIERPPFLLVPEAFTRASLEALNRSLLATWTPRSRWRMRLAFVQGVRWEPRIGETVHVRLPSRFRVSA